MTLPDGCESSGNYGTDDASFELADSYSEWDFYEDNSAIEFMLGLPNYRDFVGMEQTYLYAQYKPGFKKDKLYCASFDFTSGNLMSGETDSFENIRLSSNIIVFVFSCLAIIGYSYVAGRTFLRKRGIYSPDFLRFSAVMAKISIINSLLGIIMCSIAYNTSKKITESSQLVIDLGEADCFVYEGFNRVFSNMETYLLNGFKDSVNFTLGNLILNVFTFLSSAIYMIFYYCFSSKSGLYSK